MTINKTVKAFTLSEMLVVLLLTAIVVGLAFTILSLVQRQMSGIQNNLEAGTRFRQLHQALTIDINTYPEMTFNEQDSILVLSHAMDSITYRIGSGNLIRDVDTFKVELKQMRFFYRGLKTSEGTVDAIGLIATKDGYERDLFIFKKQDSKTLMH